MNKIYKVVWSKVKHCYVVTSELAKRQTKGCGARSLRTATVSLGVAAALLGTGAVLPIFGESVAEAGEVYVDDSGNIVAKSNKIYNGDNVTWNGETKAVTVTQGSSTVSLFAFGNISYTSSGAILNAFPGSDNVTFTVVDGQLIEIHDAPIKVIRDYPSAMDGYTENSNVSGYHITVNIADDRYLNTVYGGYSKEGNVSSNSATITNGTITNTVYGGYSGVSGNVENNNVTINGGTIGDLDNGSGAVYGAYTYNGLASNNTITINSGSTVRCPTAGSSYNGKVEENTLNINGGTIVEMAFGGVGNGTYVKSNTVNIKNDATVNATVYGGMVWGDSASDPTDVTGNTVNISDTANVNENVYGGYTYYGKVSNNTVNLNGGTVHKVYGGYTTGGAAETNHVVMNGGVVGITTTGGKTVFSGGQLYGAYSYNSSGNSGNVTGNTVTINKGTVMADIYGGNTEAKNNKSGDAIKNIVTINGGTLAGDIYGGYSRAEGNPSGKVDGNEVIIAGGVLNKAKVEINGSNVETQGVRFIYGGYTYGNNGPSESTIAYKNAVTISGGTFNNNTEVTGGYSNLYNAELNTVSITEDFTSTVGDVTGGISVYDTAKENTVTIAGGIVSNVYGGSGTVAEKNSVNITGGTVSGKVYGGHTDLGTAGGDTANDGNKVTIGSGTVEGLVYGGYSNSGDAKYNSVSISGNGQVNNTVYGGYSEKGAATGNTVSIEGGTVKASVWGGQGTSSSGNKITMSGGIFSGLLMIGGMSTSGSGDGNTVTISGGTFSGSNSIVQGGIGKPGSLNNTVNLTGTVTGLENVGLFGGGDSDNYSGNDLHVGGTKDGTVTGVWQGKTGDTVNNKVKTIARFDKVVLHSVKWDKDVAALEATTVENVKTLDITNLKFYTDAEGTTQKTSFTEGESMALLKSAESKLSSVKLDYADVTGATITTTGIILGGGATDKTEETGVNGVKLTQSVTEKVKLTEDEYAINYSCEVGEVKKVTFNASTPITFADKGIARDLASSTFASSNTVDADGLTFADSSEAIANGAFMTLVANATGITTKVDNETGKTIAIKDYEDAQKIKYSATATGTVSSADGAVKYTVSSVTLNSIDLAGWTGDASNLADGNTSGWTGAGVAVKGSFTEPEVAANSSRDILTTDVTGMFTDGAIDDAIKYKAGVTFEGDEAKGVTLTGTQSKGVKADDNGKKLVYEVGTKDVTGIALGNMTVGTPRDMNTDYNFAGVTTLDASGLTFDKPEDVSADMNLVTNAAGIPAGMDATAGKDHTQSFEQTAENNVKLTANLKGTVTTDTSVVKYAYGGKELTKVALKDWNGNEATFDATGWTKGASAAIETAGLSVTVNPGVEKTVLTVSGIDLTGITVNGEAYQWKDGGDSIVETSAENGVKITAGETTGGGIKGDGNKIIYKGSSKTVTGLEVTSVDFVKDGVARAFKNDYDLTNAAITAASDISVSNTEAMNPGDTMVVVDATNAIKVAGKEKQTLKDFATINAGKAIAFTDQIEGKALILSGTHQDTLEQNADMNQILYKVGEKNVNKATFTGEVAWNDSEAYYTNDATKHKFNGATDIDATALKVTGTSSTALKKGDAMTLISATGLKAGTVTQPKDSGSIAMNYSEKGITLAGNVAGEVKAADNAVKYEVTGVNVNKADIGSVTWQKGVTLVDRSDKANNFAGVTTIGTDKFAMTYAKPEDVAANDSMTLLKANESLKAIISEEKAKVEKAYSVTPVDGVTVNAKLTSNVANTNGNVMVTVANNQASELKFEKVEWTGSNPLIDHKTTLRNVSFNGATVDTSNIDFYKEMYIEADQQMTLVSDFGGTPKEIKGSKYMVGTAFDGEGSATMENGNLVFRTKTSAGVSEQTHKAVMGVEATMGLLASGREHAGKVLDGLGNLSNAGSDGTTVGASIGGGKDRYETGSHVNINSWSAAVGVGARKEMKKGTLQYGIFGEYGKGNYTMHSDVGRSDGDAHYAGGGLMAKWTNKHDVYTEASFRLGRVSDSTNDLLRDGAGNAYGYDIHATYYGAHVGLGKVFNYKGGKSLDVYGKFFYTKRDGAEFDAKQHYNVDSVNSSVLRIGARYGTTDKKWNWYGGLAYEYEFDGEAKGTVNGTEIRAASIKGSSVRGEFGMRMDATKDNPWRTDISIYGYGGKHRGFGGSVNVAYTF